MDTYTLILMSCLSTMDGINDLSCIEVSRVETPMPLEECVQAAKSVPNARDPEYPDRTLTFVCKINYEELRTW